MKTEEPNSNLMIFGGQAIMRGACFLHTFTLQHVSDLELGALAWSLQLWQQHGGTIGGQGARGHGRLTTLVYCDADLEAACQEYRKYAASVKDEAIAWLDAAFKDRQQKVARGKRSAEPKA